MLTFDSPLLVEMWDMLWQTKETITQPTRETMDAAMCDFYDSPTRSSRHVRVSSGVSSEVSPVPCYCVPG